MHAVSRPNRGAAADRLPLDPIDLWYLLALQLRRFEPPPAAGQQLSPHDVGRPCNAGYFVALSTGSTAALWYTLPVLLYLTCSPQTSSLYRPQSRPCSSNRTSILSFGQS